MKKFQMSNVIKLCKFNLYTSRKAIIAWSIVITSFMTLYMILFPSVQDMAQIKIEAMPEELMQLVGMNSIADMGNFMTYYGMIYGIILVAISIFAATFSAGLIAKEEKTRTIEFLSSLSVSRTEIYVSKYLTSAIAVGALLVFANVATIACGLINGGETFDMMGIISSAKISSFAAMFFGGIGLAIAGINSKIGTGATASGVVLFCYMLGYLGQLLEDKAEFLLYLSPFIAMSVEKALDIDSELLITVAIYFAIYLAAVISGGNIYKKRDLKV